tara:strand:+ start:25309 stop:25971 length:663 start_codon:yes stop_codon:yes gene_type:complete
MFPTTEVLSVSAAAHRLNKGFIKKDQVKYDSKYENAKSNSDLLYDHFYRENSKLKITKEDKDMALVIMDYLKGLSFKAIERELTDFERNVLKLITSENIEKDKIGIASSLPKVYYNKLEQDNWTDREHTLSRTSEPVGVLHARGSFNVKIEFCRYIPKTMSYLVTTSVDGKHILKFFSQKNYKIGAMVLLEGYVKDQKRGRYHNGMETILNRIKEVDQSN